MATRLRLPMLDWPMMGASILLLLIGLGTVYSATSVPGAHEGLWTRQLSWFVLALGAAWMATSLHYRAHDSLAYPLYGISLVLLVAVLAFGTSAFGAKPFPLHTKRFIAVSASRRWSKMHRAWNLVESYGGDVV